MVKKETRLVVCTKSQSQGLPNASCIYMNEKLCVYEMYIRNIYVYI